MTLLALLCAAMAQTPQSESYLDRTVQLMELSRADLPGMADMKAAGLLGLDLPPGFEVPDPSRPGDDEDALDFGEGEGDSPEFVQDYVGGEE